VNLNGLSKLFSRSLVFILNFSAPYVSSLSETRVRLFGLPLILTPY
jgi:hypothetical protein